MRAVVAARKRGAEPLDMERRRRLRENVLKAFDRPWSHLVDLLADLRVEEVFAGGGYIATGTWRPMLDRHGTADKQSASLAPSDAQCP
jgi:hypothetical protein